MSPSTSERITGGLLGLLVGDALGVPYEFTPPSEVPPRPQIEMTPPIGFRRAHAGVPPGTWSDDGSQALCLLESLLEKNALDLEDFGGRLLAWYESGHLAVDGKVFDVGVQTSSALLEIRAGTPATRAGRSDERANAVLKELAAREHVPRRRASKARRRAQARRGRQGRKDRRRRSRTGRGLPWPHA